MQINQPAGKDGVLQMQGNPVATTESPATTVASGVAPIGAQYAVVWADVPTEVQANTLTKNASAANLGDAKSISWPANTALEVPNVIVGVTTITMTDV
jgi:hypothetical protein